MDSRQYKAYPTPLINNNQNQSIINSSNNHNSNLIANQYHHTTQQQQQQYLPEHQRPVIHSQQKIINKALPPIKEEYFYPADNYPRAFSPRSTDQPPVVGRPQPQSRPNQYPAEYNVTHQGVSNFEPRPSPVLRPVVRYPVSPAYHNAPGMEPGRGYTIPQNVPQSVHQGNINHQQQTLQHQPTHLQSSSSPYSTSPQLRGSYPGSPATQPAHYTPQKSDKQLNDVLALLEEKVSAEEGHGQPPLYQQTQQSPQVAPQGYTNPQNYSQSPPNLLYYPYHRDFLNSSTENVDNYLVKLPSGVIHQYPTPDYVTNSPPQVPLPDYPSANGYAEHPKTNVSIQNPSYMPPNVVDNTVYQDPSSPPNQLPPYDDLGSYIDPQLNAAAPSPQQNQYNQLLTQIVNKQDTSPAKQQLPRQGNQQQVYTVPVSDYNTYRTTNLDSPQGSPMPANPQAPNTVYKMPATTPPLPRKTQSARQVSNETYSSIGSPSNQLLLGDMSLNSPRPRSETVDMEAPAIPPRSPNRPPERSNDGYANPNDIPALAPSLQMASSRPAPVSSQPNTSSNERRLRSGTVEMVDAGGSRHMPPPPPGAAPSQRYLPSNQLNMPQRSRAGTVEMADSSAVGVLNPPERRIRSGTVEMTEVGGSQYPSSMPPPQQQPGTVQYAQPLPQQLPQVSQPVQYVNSHGNQQPLQPQDSKLVQPVKVSAPSNQQYVKSPPAYSTLSNGQIPSTQPVVYSNTTAKHTPTQPSGSTTSSPAPSPATPSRQTTDNNSRQQTPTTTSITPKYAQTPDYKHPSYSQTPPGTSPLQHHNIQYSQPQQQDNIQTYNIINQGNIPQTDSKQYILTQGSKPVVYTKQEVVNSPDSGRSSLPPPTHNNVSSGLPSPGSQLSVENLKLSPHQKASTQTVKSEYDPDNVNVPASQYTDREISQQQKAMQQQYLQRVRQAQLQQQLRQIQTEYENSLQVEQDIAQEFLREQGLNGDTYQRVNTNNQPIQNIGSGYQPQPQTQTPPQMQPLQHSYPQQYQPQNIPSRSYQDQVGGSPQYAGPNMPPPHMQQPPNQHPSNTPPQHRIPYSNKDVPVFPVTGLPINQPMYPQPRMPYQQQMAPQQGMGNQPILIMPGGGSFSNPGQFVPTGPGPVTGQRMKQPPPQMGSQTPTGSSQSRKTGGSSGKQQTPFLKLRKIAEEISSFVDDVVKFTGKKGDHEYKYLEEMLTQQLLLLDKVAASGSDELRNARKALVKEVQELLEILERRATNKS